MTQSRPYRTEVVVAVISLIGSVAAAYIAYQANHRSTAIASQLSHYHERQKPFLNRQLALYFNVVDIASRIANAAASDDSANLKREFWRHYWGQMGIVEDSGVIAAMIAYGDGLKAGATSSQLQRLAIRLATACRKSLSQTWSLDLEDIDSTMKSM